MRHLPPPRLLLAWTVALALLPLLPLPPAVADQPYPPATFPELAPPSAAIQRTLRRLAQSTTENPETVRLLFYGQSLTTPAWTDAVVADLHRRFPHARLITENRALGGYSASHLVRTAETDIPSFRPDLIVFHVFGDHHRYEDLIRHIRETTTAELLIQNDPVALPADLHEETDPALLEPRSAQWSAFMNHRFLPSLADRYQAALCDVRGPCKHYLRTHGLAPADLLADAIHPNNQGQWLMAACVNANLQLDPTLPPSPADAWITTLHAGPDLPWHEGVLRLAFEGTALEAFAEPGTLAEITIDGLPPSQLSEARHFTRALASPGGPWPVIAPLRSASPLLIEDWTLQARLDPQNSDRIQFSLSGSLTGEDGVGASDAPFTSRSARVRIEPADWIAAYAFSLAGIQPMPEVFTVRWQARATFSDTLETPDRLTPIPLVSGLPNRRHQLEIRTSDPSRILALRLHRPPRAARSP